MERADIIARFAEVARDPLAYAKDWKERTGKQVIGSFPMNFPGELAHAANTLPRNCHVNTGPLAELDIFRSCYA